MTILFWVSNCCSRFLIFRFMTTTDLAVLFRTSRRIASSKFSKKFWFRLVYMMYTCSSRGTYVFFQDLNIAHRVDRAIFCSPGWEHLGRKVFFSAAGLYFPWGMNGNFKAWHAAGMGMLHTHAFGARTKKSTRERFSCVLRRESHENLDPTPMGFAPTGITRRFTGTSENQMIWEGSILPWTPVENLDINGEVFHHTRKILLFTPGISPSAVV